MPRSQSACLRRYGRPDDFDLVGRFLIASYLPGNRDGNWIQPEWEYMHYHPSLNAPVLDRIGIWEDGGEVAAVVHFESDLGEAFFQVGRGYAGLKEDMLRYAEEHLAGPSAPPATGSTLGTTAIAGGPRTLRAYVFEYDDEAALAHALGFVAEQTARSPRPTACYDINGPVPVPPLPAGFRLQSLAEDNDLEQIHRVMWRGFDHQGRPPPEGIAWRVRMQAAPSFAPELNIVVEAPDGRFASYAGTWYEPYSRIAYIEPVATDPDYRRMGLGRTAVLEGIRRCAERGATVAYVGSWQHFYLAIGFRKLFRHHRWVKRLPGT